MKKIISIIVSCILCLGFVGCSSSSTTKSVDDQFIADLEKGLSARFELEQSSMDDSTENWDSYINAELDAISKYKDETFDNKDLETEAKSYIDALEQYSKITEYVDSDYTEFTEKEVPLRKQRLTALVNINDLNPLSFDDEDNQNAFDLLMKEGQLCVEVQQIIDQVTFKKSDSKEDEPFYTYYAEVENTTSTDFDSFNFNVNLYDEDGNLVSTETPFTDSWKKGEKARFEFWADPTTFTEMKVESATYYYE